jgi:hypothetical protein
MILTISRLKNGRYQKNSFNEKCAPKSVLFIEKENQKDSNDS